jgi:hypothetical protein
MGHAAWLGLAWPRGSGHFPLVRASLGTGLNRPRRRLGRPRLPTARVSSNGHHEDEAGAAQPFCSLGGAGGNGVEAALQRPVEEGSCTERLLVRSGTERRNRR